MKYLLMLAAIFCILSSVIYGVSPSPELLKELKENNQLKELKTRFYNAYKRGINNPTKRMFKIDPDKDGGVDTLRIPVIIVDFPDQPYTDSYSLEQIVAGEAYQFDSVLFSEGLINPTGSVTEYYLENSYRKLYVAGDVYGWYRMPNSYAYYTNDQNGIGDYPQNSQGLLLDALSAADAEIDFSQYDRTGPEGIPDGYVDGVFLIHSGIGAEQTGRDDQIWSHMWGLNEYAVSLDGKTIDLYSTIAEEFGYVYGLTKVIFDVCPISIFCHELGHILGLPDLYDPDYDPETSRGLGDWSLMASGSWNFRG